MVLSKQERVTALRFNIVLIIECHLVDSDPEDYRSYQFKIERISSYASFWNIFQINAVVL